MMTDTAPGAALDDERLRELVQRYVALDTERRALVDELDRVKARMRDELGPGRFRCDDVTVSIAPVRRFDPELAMQVIPRELRPLVLREVVDARAAREALPPQLYARCQRDGDTLSVRVA